MSETVDKQKVRLWVEALRNPDLVQGYGALAKRGSEDEPWKQCCLDVACRVAMDNGLPLEEVIQNSAHGSARGYVVPLPAGWVGEQPWHEYTTMPKVVRTWYGFDFCNAYPLKYGGRDGLTAIDLNDELKLSFAEIADIIEAQYLAEES